MSFPLPSHFNRADAIRNFTPNSSALSWLFLATSILLLLTTAGCASTPDPDPPELGASIDATNARLHSLDAFERSVSSDLDRLEMLGEDIRVGAHRAAQAELPLSILRLVAINCLNSGYDADTSDTGVLGTTPLSCEPAHIQRLVDELDTVSTADRDRAHELLYLVDQTRHIRGMLRRRLARLADSANDHLDFIADERAMLRQMEADLHQRRNLYSTQGFDEALAAIEDHRELLDSLAVRIEELADEYLTWSPRIDEIVSDVYFELSYLRAEREK